MSSPTDVRKADGDELVDLLPQHLRAIYKLRPSSTFLEGKMREGDHSLGRTERNSQSMRFLHSDTTSNASFDGDLMPPRRRYPLLLTPPQDESIADSFQTALTSLTNRKSKNKIIGDSYRPPKSFLYDWTVSVNIEDIRAYVHSELITDQGVKAIVFIQRQIRLLRHSMAILRLLESARRRALIIPRIIFRLWRIDTFVLRMYRHILYLKTFSAWRIEMLLVVKRKQMDYACDIFLQSKYFAYFKERARISTELNLFVVTFTKRINLRVTNDIFQFLLYLMKYLRMYRKSLKAYLEANEELFYNHQDLQLPADHPQSVYKSLIRSTPIKFYDIAKALVPSKPSYLIENFLADIQYHAQMTVYIKQYLLKYTLISPIFVSWLTAIRMLHIRKKFLLLTYDKLLITAFYRWSSLARGRHKLMTKYIQMWRQYIDKLRMQRYKILLANQFRVRFLAQTHLRRWKEYCLSKDIVRMTVATSLVHNSSYSRFFIRTLYLLLDGSYVYDNINNCIVKKLYIIDIYEEGGKSGFKTACDSNGFLILPTDSALIHLEEQKVQQEEEEKNKKTEQLRSLFDIPLKSHRTFPAAGTFMTQHTTEESDSDNDNIKNLVAPRPRKLPDGKKTPMPFFDSYNEEFCIKFRIFQRLKQRSAARKAFLRFIFLLQVAIKMYKKAIVIRFWKQYVAEIRERKRAEKRRYGAMSGAVSPLNTHRGEKSQDIFLTMDLRSRDGAGTGPTVPNGATNLALDQDKQESFVKLLFFKTHSLILLNVLFKMAHAPTAGAALTLFTFIPELDRPLFKSVVSTILSFSIKELSDSCYLSNKMNMGSIPAATKTMQLISSVFILLANFKYASFGQRDTLVTMSNIKISTWDKRIHNLKSLLKHCEIDTVYSLVANYNKLQSVVQMEASLLESYKYVDLDVTPIVEAKQEPLETLLPQMLQEDIAVCNLFAEKHELITSIMNTAAVSETSNSLVEQLKHERMYLTRDRPELTADLAKDLLLFDVRASNSLLIHRLLDAFSTEISVGITSKVEERLSTEAQNLAKGQNNKLRVEKLTEHLDKESKTLKLALCECFAPTTLPKPLLLCLANTESVTIVISDPTPVDKYCMICQGCLCLYCSCEHRCVCMRNNIMRRALIFKNYANITYPLYKQIDGSLTALSDIDESYTPTPEEYRTNFQTALRCFQVFAGGIYLRCQIDKDYLRFLLMNGLGDVDSPTSPVANVLPSAFPGADGDGKIHASPEPADKEPVASVIMAHLKKGGKAKKKAKGKSKSSPKKPVQTPIVADPTPSIDVQADLNFNLEVGTTADLLISYAGRELIEKLEVYKQIKSIDSPEPEQKSPRRPVVTLSNERMLRNAILYTEVMFNAQLTPTEAPLRNVYLPLDDLVKEDTQTYTEVILDIQQAQERLLAPELSEYRKETEESQEEAKSERPRIPPITIPSIQGPPPTATQVTQQSPQKSTEESLSDVAMQPAAGPETDSQLSAFDQQFDSSFSKTSTTRNTDHTRYKIEISENVTSSANSIGTFDSAPSVKLQFPESISVVHGAAQAKMPAKGPAKKDKSKMQNMQDIVFDKRSKFHESGLVADKLAAHPNDYLQDSNSGSCSDILQPTSDKQDVAPIKESSHDVSLLDIFQDLSPERESSSRSLIMSSQAKTRETMRQISMRIDEELSRIISAPASKSEGTRVASSSTASRRARTTEPGSRRATSEILHDIDVDLERLASAVYRKSDTRSCSQPSIRPGTRQTTANLQDQDCYEESTEPGSIVRLPSSQSSSRPKSTAFRPKTVLNSIAEVTSSCIDTQRSNMQVATDTDTNSVVIMGVAEDDGSARPAAPIEPTLVSDSDRILAQIQNIQSKFVDVETDSAEERVAHLFKHLQHHASEDEAALNWRGHEKEKTTHTTQIADTESGSESDNELKQPIDKELSIKYLSIAQDITKTLSRQLKLRGAGGSVPPVAGAKAVSRNIQQKLLNELKMVIPGASADTAMSKMQSGLVDASMESANVTQISTRNLDDQSLFHNTQNETTIYSTYKPRKDILTLVHFSDEPDDLQLSDEELLIKRGEDSFVINLDSVSSSFSEADLALSGSNQEDVASTEDVLDMTELPKPQKKITIYRGARAFERQFGSNDKIGKVENRYNHRAALSARRTRVTSASALRDLNALVYTRALKEYRQMQDMVAEERTVSSADAYPMNKILQRKQIHLKNSGILYFNQRLGKPARTFSSPAMKYHKRHEVQETKNRRSLYVHLAAAKKEAHVCLPSLAKSAETTFITSLGHHNWHTIAKPVQTSLLPKHSVTKRRRSTHSMLLSPVYLSSESSSTIPDQSPVKAEYITAWRKARKLKYDGSANLAAQLEQAMETVDDAISRIPDPEIIAEPAEVIKDYIVSKIQTNILLTQEDSNTRLNLSLQEVSEPSSTGEVIPSKLSSEPVAATATSSSKYAALVQQRNAQFVRVMEEFLRENPITSRDSELINVLSVSTSSLYDLTAETDKQETSGDGYELIKRFAKDAPTKAIQNYDDISYSIANRKKEQQTKVELMTFNSGANSYYSPMTISAQNEAATPTMVQRKTDSESTFALTPLSAWEAADRPYCHDHVVTYPEMKMTDENFHNIVVSQTFEILSKAIQIAHGNQMITSQRCHEFAEAQKMSTLEIAAGTARAQNIRNLYSKRAHMMFSRSVQQALQRRILTVKPEPVIRGFGFRSNEQSINLSHGGPDLLASLLKWRHSTEGDFPHRHSRQSAKEYVVQSHKLTKGEIMAFQNAAWISSGTRQVSLDVSNFKLLGMPASQSLDGSKLGDASRHRVLKNGTLMRSPTTYNMKHGSKMSIGMLARACAAENAALMSRALTISPQRSMPTYPHVSADRLAKMKLGCTYFIGSSPPNSLQDRKYTISKLLKIHSKPLVLSDKRVIDMKTEVHVVDMNARPLRKSPPITLKTHPNSQISSPKTVRHELTVRTPVTTDTPQKNVPQPVAKPLRTELQQHQLLTVQGMVPISSDSEPVSQKVESAAYLKKPRASKQPPGMLNQIPTSSMDTSISLTETDEDDVLKVLSNS